MCFRWHEFCKNNRESNILPLKLHSSYQKKTHIKNGITQVSSANRSWAMVVHITVGGHFELCYLCAYRPLGGGGALGATPFCLRCFLKTVYIYVTPCKIITTCHQVSNLSEFPPSYMMRLYTFNLVLFFCENYHTLSYVNIFVLHIFILSLLHSPSLYINPISKSWFMFGYVKPKI